jgi:ATP synthase I chain
MSEETKPIIEETSSVEKRLWRLLLAALLLEILVSLWWLDWRLTCGILVGGSLAIFNFHLLQTSVRGLWQTQSNSFAVRFILRYFVIGLVVFGFYYLNIVSIFGILIGISSFVAALMLEAGIQLYFVITNHEEN